MSELTSYSMSHLGSSFIVQSNLQQPRMVSCCEKEATVIQPETKTLSRSFYQELALFVPNHHSPVSVLQSMLTLKRNDTWVSKV